MAELQTKNPAVRNDANELIEIELPSIPALDWWFWGELFFLLLLVILIVWIAFSARRQFWGSLKSQYQLNKQLLKLKNSVSNTITTADCLRMNQLFLNVKLSNQLEAIAVKKLTERFNEACFSGREVSCEALICLLSDLLLELKK